MAKGQKETKKMASVNATKTTIKLQSSVTDLDTMEEVLLVKNVEFEPVTSAQQAIERLGGSSEKLLSVINEGLMAETRRNAKTDPSIPWMEEDENDNLTPFAGTVADTKVVNGLVLNLAKGVFGYNRDMKREEKKAAKESAIALIKSSEPIREGLKKNAAVSAAE